MAVEAQSEQQEAVELEQGGKLTRARLDRYKITETAGEVMDGRARLACIPALGLEGERLFYVDMSEDLIQPNPDQPREYFKPAKMSELEGTIKEMGQKQPINVVPIVLKNGTVKLFIIDGERRYRAIKKLGLPYIKVVVNWVKDEEEILLQSLILNESKDDHNPIERAKSYKKLIKFAIQKGVQNPGETVAKKVGISYNSMYVYLQLLEHLSPELQGMVAQDKISMGAATSIVEACRKYGNRLNLDTLTEIIKSKKGLSEIVVKAAIQETLRRHGYRVEAEMHAIQNAVRGLVANLVGIQRVADIIVNADPDKVIDYLLERGAHKKPPEAIRDRIQAIQGLLAKVHDIVNGVSEPLPLEKIPGKPSFTNCINRRRQVFEKVSRLKIALVLAKAADEHGKFMASDELVQQCEVESSVFANNIRVLPSELAKIGLELQEHVLKRKDSRGHLAKKTAYRLAWLKEDPKEDSGSAEEPVAQPAGRPTASEERLAALRAAHQRVQGRLQPKGGGDEEDEDGSENEDKDDVLRQDNRMPLKRFEIAVLAPESEPALLNAAQKIAKNIQNVESRGTVRGNTEFGNRLGVKIEILTRRGEKIYVVKSNVRSFSLNFRLSARVFRDFIAEALRVEQNTITVDVQDL